MLALTKQVDYVHLSRNLHIHYVQLSRNLHIHYVQTSTSMSQSTASDDENDDDEVGIDIILKMMSISVVRQYI